MNKPILEILREQFIPHHDVMDILRQIVNKSGNRDIAICMIEAYNLGRIRTLQELRAKKKAAIGQISKTKQANEGARSPKDELKAIQIIGIGETALRVSSLCKDISSMPVEEIEELRKTVQTEIEKGKYCCKNIDKVPEFVDLLMDACIKIRGHQESFYSKQISVARVIESLPQQDDSISCAI
ncbi:hypothetical protein Ami103574_00100 [Aminipila butyrica]|uniref:Uncharacterized protein n=1 Tax=Aminipila butyrica TaxID=433296 RepID=A0A858BRR8_9FIRM|nr:hypothetical protein [Aminipila butyrica]QIB67815.1 hypothetical protein Ami103574_00100 [Aminipila butyrica]